jgi:hypothetical protein
VDEIPTGEGMLYLPSSTVVVDHDTKRLVWAEQGRDKATLRRFFDDLGEDRSARITHVRMSDSGSEVGAGGSGAVRGADLGWF